MKAVNGSAPIDSPLADSELVAPQEIDEEQLGVVPVVQQLKDLIRVVEPGAAIGLFGSPGIGKSTIGTLLEKSGPLVRRAGDDGTTTPVEFISFDASEASAEDLRRQLVLTCADGLNVDRDRVDRKLRGERKLTRYVKPRLRHLRILALCLLILAVLVLLGLGVAGIVSLVSGEEFKTIANDFVLAMLLVPAVAAAFIGILVKGMTTEWSIPASTSENEFARRLDDVLDRADRTKRRQLLIFIDEIDRWPHEKVADALDGVRTFFGNRRCVFVLAADRQTLERALAHKLGDLALDHASNPYYGAASAYLDKLFQYQVVVPPPRTDALYQYARRVTSGRGGVWRCLADDDKARLVLSVLIPPHVTSPRQVKALLNGFVLAYRLLVRRGVVGFDDETMPEGDRMAEVAKLVCLRCEFPLFAADLHVDPDLPKLVLLASRRRIDGVDVAPDRAERALAYAKGGLPVSTVSLDEDERGDAADDLERELRRQQTRQLVRYLDETEAIDGPGRDLIHAQGLNTDLPNSIAEALAEAALQDDAGKLHQALHELRARARSDARRMGGGSVDDAVHKDERDALHVLSRRVRARQSTQARAAMRILLQAIAECQDALDEDTARSVASRIRPFLKHAVDLGHVEHGALSLLGDVAANADVIKAADDLGAPPVTRDPAAL